MSQISSKKTKQRKSKIILYNSKTDKEMAAKSSEGKRKKARLNNLDADKGSTVASVSVAATTTTTTTTAANSASTTKPNNNISNSGSGVFSDVEIKTECIDEEELIEIPDIKPDLNELNKELLQEHPNTLMLQPSVLPTLYIISQLPSNCIATTDSTAAAATTRLAGQVVALESAAPQLATTSANSSISINTTITTTAATKYFEETLTKDELDLQQSDSDEDGYSDIDFGEDDELIEDDEEIDYYDPQWTDQPTAPRMVCDFDTMPQNVGLQGRPKSLEPGYYVNKILGCQQQFFKRLASSSNAKAKLQMGTNKSSQIYLKDISCDEMKVFVGICLQMSTIKLRFLADYWNESGVWGFKGFGSKMSLSRFQLIMHVLSFEHLLPFQFDVGATGTEDAALSGIKPLVDFFNLRMKEIYNCGQRLVLNDPILFWKGRFSWFSDVRPKFRCNSVLLHLLTEYTGLIQRLDIDVERKERRVNERNSKLLIQQRIGVAKRLLWMRLERGHTVYASKYYGSYALAYELAAHRTYCTGVVDVKRYGNCKELVLNHLEPNSFATKYAGSIMMGKWRNRQKSIYFYSSDCLAIYAKETSLRTIDRRPKIIKELDWQLNWKLSEEMKENMLNYQLCLERKEIKWDKQIVVYVFNLVIFNAYILYILHAQLGRTRFTELHLRDTTNLKNYAEFRQDFISTLLNDVVEVKTNQNLESEVKEKKRSSVSAAAESEEEDDSEEQQPKHAKLNKNLLNVEHLPMIVPRRNGKATKKRCRICCKGGMLAFSKLCCEICPGMPGLCETPCFKVWHDQLKKSLEAGVNIKTRIFGTSEQKTIYF